ncbi:hypothetical protein, partial [Enterococcus faecium]|uniref:hypothetical protein n=1 Tax=Enterococcus faecium TaxID=1352 RepID=UPI0029307D5C
MVVICINFKSINPTVEIPAASSISQFTRRKSFFCRSEEVLEQLKENTDGKSNDLSTAKRQHAILAELLLTTEPLSLA